VKTGAVNKNARLKNGELNEKLGINSRSHKAAFKLQQCPKM
jgi:hypothetical protein